MTDAFQLVLAPHGQLQIKSLGFSEKKQNSLEISPQTKQELALSIVIPTYNESGNLEPLLKQLTTTLDQSLLGQYELILVDDDSPDLTWQLGLNLTSLYPQLRVMRRQGEKGLSTAVVRGWQVARGQVLGVIDADLQHPPEKLLELFQKMVAGADLAVASRHVEGGGVSEWSFLRRFLSRGAQMLGLMILPNVVGRVTDPMSGYFLVQREAIADVQLNPQGYKILLEVIGRGNIVKVAEVGYVFQERTEGESKVSYQHYFDYIYHLLRLRSRGRVGRFYKKFSISRLLKFGVVGFSGVFIDMGLLYLLHTGFGFPLTRSKILSAEVAVINNFLLNDAWTFSDMSRAQKGWKKRLKRFLKFNLICLSGLVLNVLVLNIVYNLIFGQRWAYLANLIAIATVTAWNFWMSLKLGWRVTQTNK
ncbi:MAG: glycosyltransferase [Leptolyngbya sp. SIO1D8]|nr:glycosyltransferase [Leptolyngbya sp. SIO1D8]